MANGDAISGKQGSLTFGDTPVTVRIRKFSFKRTMEIRDSTDSGSGTDKEYVAEGFKDKTVSFEFIYRKGTAKPTFGAVATFSLIADTGITFDGDAIINDESTEVNVTGTDMVLVTASAQGTGAWTETNPSV